MTDSTPQITGFKGVKPTNNDLITVTLTPSRRTSEPKTRIQDLEIVYQGKTHVVGPVTTKEKDDGGYTVTFKHYTANNKWLREALVAVMHEVFKDLTNGNEEVLK